MGRRSASSGHALDHCDTDNDLLSSLSTVQSE